MVSNESKGLKHYHSCALQHPEFKLNLESIQADPINNESAVIKRDKRPDAPASHRSTR